MPMVVGRRTLLKGLSTWLAGCSYGLCPAQTTDADLRAPVFSADAAQVLIPFTAEDRRHRFIDGLTSDDFRLLADGREQRINFVSVEEAPASLVFVVDVSSSMKKPLEDVREAMRRMLRAAQTDDEFALIEFADSAELTVDFTNMSRRLDDRINAIEPAGRTSLNDAVLLGLREIQRAHQTRRALIVISDGRDNHSRHVRSDTLRYAVETDARIYAIEMYPPIGEGFAEPTMLETLAHATGGRYLPTVRRHNISDLIQRIDVHRAYVLGFTPPDEHRDDRLHQVDLKLRRKPPGERVKLFWKERYRVPSSF